LAAPAVVMTLAVSQNGRDVSAVRLVIVPGQTAQWTVRTPSGQRLAYKIHVDPRDLRRVTAWLDVESGRDQVAGALATCVLLPAGRPVRTGEIVAADGTYDLTMGVYVPGAHL
jgi:hypothetical protein